MTTMWGGNFRPLPIDQSFVWNFKPTDLEPRKTSIFYRPEPKPEPKITELDVLGEMVRRRFPTISEAAGHDPTLSLVKTIAMLELFVQEARERESDPFTAEDKEWLAAINRAFSERA